MATQATAADFAAVARRATHPPIRETRFWIIQAMVLIIAGLHLFVDMHLSVEAGTFPAGIPVAVLIFPVGYAGLRYGLAGSAATLIWAAILWLPDLLLPLDRGHVGGDLVDLTLIGVVAFFFGQRIDAERLAHARVERATAETLASEVRFRRLFETNRAPILVVDAQGLIADANPAAQALFGGDVAGRSGTTILDGELPLVGGVGSVLCLPDGRDYRVDLVAMPAGTGDPSTQMIFEDVTEERSEGRRATHYAALVLQTEEDQRRRLARELHDEPLQLFLHLARRLESLSGVQGVPASVSEGLAEARRQALDAADRLRTVARDLRPPALDQLGLVAALSSLVAEVEDEAGLVVQFKVVGVERRLTPEVELGAFRIVQEAVRNAVRHAGSVQLRVTVEFRTDELWLEVVDEGRGFDPERPEQHGSGRLGLLGMRERTRLLGGHLALRSVPGQGTVIEATIPFDGSAPGSVDTSG